MKLVKLSLSLLLLFQNNLAYSQVSSTNNLNKTVEIVSKFKNTHDLTRHVLKSYKHSDERKEYFKSVLNREPAPLPKYEVKKDKIYFSLNERQHSIKFVKEDTYILDGKKVRIDLKNEKFISVKKQSISTGSILNLLLYPIEAEAAVPMMLVYFAVVAGVVTIGFRCTGENITRYFNVDDSFTFRTERAQSARLRRMNQALNEAVASVVPFCAGAANASVSDLGLEYINYERAFSDYCDQMADSVSERAARTTRSRGESYIARTQAFDEGGAFNAEFEEELTRAPAVYDVGEVSTEFLENMTFERCSTQACRDRNPERVSFSELSEPSQQIIRAHLQDQNFSRSCALDSLERTGVRNVRSFRQITETIEEAEAQALE